MTCSDWVSIISLIIAVVALVYSMVSNTKKYELTYQYYNDVLNWHNSSVETIKNLSLCTGDEERHIYLAKLSALIENGRFYFPNVNKHDGFGLNKPIAYQGYRNIILDFLVFEYQLFEKNNWNEYLEHINVLQRLFTAEVYKYLEPIKLKKKIHHNTAIINKDEITINDFINKSPQFLYALYPIDNNSDNWQTPPILR